MKNNNLTCEKLVKEIINKSIISEDKEKVNGVVGIPDLKSLGISCDTDTIQDIATLLCILYIEVPTGYYSDYVDTYAPAEKFADAVYYMDDDLREFAHGFLAPCSRERFLAAYEMLHLLKYGENLSEQLHN